MGKHGRLARGLVAAAVAATAGCTGMPAPAPIPTVVEAVVLDDSGSAQESRARVMDFNPAQLAGADRRIMMRGVSGSTNPNDPTGTARLAELEATVAAQQVALEAEHEALKDSGRACSPTPW